MKNDRNARFDIYTEMKKEDRKFGEKSGKATAKDQKRPKYAIEKNFSKMAVSDILAMSDEYADEEEFA